MPYANPDSLVSTEWLAANLTAADLRLVDASWHMPGSGRDARGEYGRCHIPGAVFFDIDEIADQASDLPHMLPTAEAFADKVGALGLGDGCRIVVYDSHGLMSATRVWWTLRVFGHRSVAVLDGGLPKWIAEKRPIDDRPTPPRHLHFTSRIDHTLVRDMIQLRANLASRHEQVLDARGQGRFHGTEPEPRPGLRSGHIPGSFNLPFTSMLDPATKTLLPAEFLFQGLHAAGVDMNRPVVCTCGSGITAAVLFFGLHLLGHKDISLYDGSWAEWGRPGDNPVEQ